MEAWVGVALDHLWRNALAAVPLALLVAGVCRWLPCKPTTRHALWAMLLAWLILPPLLPDLSQPTTDAPAETTIAEISQENVGGSDSAESSLGAPLHRFDQSTSPPPSVITRPNHLYVVKSASDEDLAEQLARPAPDRSALR